MVKKSPANQTSLTSGALGKFFTQSSVIVNISPNIWAGGVYSGVAAGWSQNWGWNRARHSSRARAWRKVSTQVLLAENGRCCGMIPTDETVSLRYRLYSQSREVQSWKYSYQTPTNCILTEILGIDKSWCGEARNRAVDLRKGTLEFCA